MRKLNNELLRTIKEEAKKTVIYGAGRVARTALEKLLCDGIDIECLMVTNMEKNPFQIMGKPVMCIDEVSYENSAIVILLCVLEDKQERIENTLKQRGYRNIYGLTDQLFYQWEKELEHMELNERRSFLKRYVEPYTKTLDDICRERETSSAIVRQFVIEKLNYLQSGRVCMPRLVVVLSTKCSLRCKECNNLMPFFKPQRDADIEKTMHALELLTQKTASILKCELIGGEPFLSLNLKRVLNYVIQSKVIEGIEITTNGTIIPSEELLPLLKNPKVLVRISDYGKLVDKSKIEKFLVNNGVHYMVLALGKWISPGGVERRKRDKESLRKSYWNCSSGYYCKTLYEDKVFSCARAASLYMLERMPDEYVEIDDRLTGKEIKDFLLRDYSTACDYCDIAIDEPVIVEPAEQLRDDTYSEVIK